VLTTATARAPIPTSSKQKRKTADIFVNAASALIPTKPRGPGFDRVVNGRIDIGWFGKPAPGPTTAVHYDFMTTGVPSSTSGLDLVLKP
jgi:hypothetical protein